MTPETAHALPQAQREAPGYGSGPPDPPQASQGPAPEPEQLGCSEVRFATDPR